VARCGSKVLWCCSVAALWQAMECCHNLSVGISSYNGNCRGIDVWTESIDVAAIKISVFVSAASAASCPICTSDGELT
jgi:hypothetical protein